MPAENKTVDVITAYGYAKAGGYEGTEAQFKALLAGVDTKANKASNPTAGHLATLDANGNLADSGKAYPTSLKNPSSLTFGSKTYDGSAAKTVELSDLDGQAKITASGILKGNGSGTISAADATALKTLLDTLSAISPATADKIPLTDVSGGTAGFATIADILSLASGAKIAVGSYTGTGTYGASNPCSLTFPFVPTAVILFGYVENSYNRFFSLEWGKSSDKVTAMVSSVLTTTPRSGVGFGYQNANNNWGEGYRSADGKTFYWSSVNNADNQFNSGGTTYHYLAVGS